MKTWTIGKRILFSSGAMLALILAVAAISSFVLQRIEREAQTSLLDDAIPGIVEMSNISIDALRQHIRALMIGSSTDPKLQEEYAKDIEAGRIRVNEAAERYERAINSDADRQNFTEFARRRTIYAKSRDAYIALARAGKTQEADKFLFDQLDPAYREFREQVVTLLTWNQTTATKSAQGIVKTTGWSGRLMLILSAFIIAVGLGTSWLTIRTTNRDLQAIATVLSDASAQVSSAAGQVASSSQTLAEGASEQASALEETSASLEEIASMSKRNATGAADARNLAADANRSTEHGSREVGSMVSAMDEIKSSSNNIANIIKTIDEIAFQTNILALNAAVEAARAGEAGAGFAVVADEVRSLAQRAARAARETAEKIDDSIKKSSQGAEISTTVAGSLGEINDKVGKVNTLVADIATASQEQLQGLAQVNGAVGQMDKVTQSNAAAAEETASAAEELNSQAEALLESVNDLLRLVGAHAKDISREHVATTTLAAKTATRTRQAPKMMKRMQPPAPDLNFQDVTRS